MTLEGIVQRLNDRITQVQIPGIKNATAVFPMANGVLHVLVVSALEFEFSGGPVDVPIIPTDLEVSAFKVSKASIIEIYLGENGVNLLKLSKTAKPGNDTSFVIFLEVNNHRDLLSPPVFEITAINGKQERDFFKETAMIKPVLMDVLDVSDDAYTELVESRFEERRDSDSSVVGDFVRDIADDGMDWLIKQLTDFSNKLKNYKMPRELWHPNEAPADFNKFLNDLSRTIDNTINDGLKAVSNLPRLDLTGFIDDHLPLPMASLPDIIVEFINSIKDITRKIDSRINGLIEFIEETAEFVKSNKPDTIDSLNTLIGYICGLWDGAIDLVAGFIELVTLGLKLLKLKMAFDKEPRRTLQLLLESLDQIFHAFSKIDWAAFWKHLKEETLPKVMEALEFRLDELLNEFTRNSASAGYYLGYLVFNIIESFFPPLKFSKVAAVSEQASKVALYTNKIMQ